MRGDLVHVRHAAHVYRIPPRARSARGLLAESSAPARLREVGSAELRRIGTIRQYSEEIPVLLHDGHPWIPISGSAGRLGSRELRTFLETGDPGPLLYSGDHGLFGGTPLRPLVHDARKGVTYGEIVPLPGGGTLTRDERDRAAEAAARLVEEDLLVGGGLAYARLRGPFGQFAQGPLAGGARFIRNPRELAFLAAAPSLLVGLAGAEDYRSAVASVAGRPARRQAEDGRPNHGIEAELPPQPDDEAGILCDALPGRAFALAMEAGFGRIGPDLLDRATDAYVWASRATAGTIRPGEREGVAREAGALIEALMPLREEAGREAFLPLEHCETLAVIRTWLPGILARPVPAEDAAAFEALAP